MSFSKHCSLSIFRKLVISPAPPHIARKLAVIRPVRDVLGFIFEGGGIDAKRAGTPGGTRLHLDH